METGSIFEEIKNFENFIESALIEKYSIFYGPEQFWTHMMDKRTNPLLRWNLQEFINIYNNSGYPDNRLAQLLYKMVDIKMQIYYLREVDLGLYNREIYDKLNNSTVRDSPHFHLMKLSFHQNLIGKSRILWERVMNFIYFLETGEELESKKSNNKSKKKAFFEYVSNNEKWKFILGYNELIEKYDSMYRTPEFHKNSTLRREVFGKGDIDANKLMLLSNEICGQLYDSILDIIKGNSVLVNLPLNKLEQFE